MSEMSMGEYEEGLQDPPKPEPEEIIEIVHADGVAPLTIRTRKTSDEPREQDADEWRYGFFEDRDYLEVSGTITSVIAAVLAEGARQDASTYWTIASDAYGHAIERAALAIREAIRLKAGT